MKILGYSVAFSTSFESAPEYELCTQPLCLGGHVFLTLEDAETVLAAEKLKSPTMKWSIVEVHEAQP